MKVILTAAVSALGKIGDVVEVKNGYARNFLIPNKKAICSTLNNRKIFDLKRQEFEQANQKNLDLAGKIKDQISGKDIIIIENASDDGRLYGSVNSSVIADALNKVIGQKIIVRSDIFLKKPIKEIGIYEAKLATHSEVAFDVRLVVTRSESEIAALLKAGKKSSSKSGQEEVSEVASEEQPKAIRKKSAPKTEKKLSAE